MTDSGRAVSRPRFTEGQFITGDRLRAENDYRNGVARRHLLGGHTSGIVSGLEIVEGDEVVEIRPGMAVDHLGRLLVVSKPVEVDLSTSDSGRLYLSLAGRTRPSGDASSGRADRDATVTVVCAGPTPPPSTVAVPLGLVIWGDGTVDVGSAGRVHVGLVGDEVMAPSGKAAMYVGTVADRGGGRFAVATRSKPPTADEADPASESTDGTANTDNFDSTEETAEAPGEPPLERRFELDRQGDSSFSADTRLQGDAIICPAALLGPSDHQGLRFDPTTNPTEARPWNLYRTTRKVDGRTIRELRVELLHPGDGGLPEQHRFVIGKTKSETFNPYLTVDADCTVTVDGNLTVGGGAVLEPEIPLDITDERFVREVVFGYVHGTTSGSSILDSSYGAAFTVDIIEPTRRTIEAGTQITIEVEVVNVGSGPAIDNTILLTIFENDTLRIQLPFSQLGTIEPGGLVTQTQDYTVPRQVGTEVTINALAYGVRPAQTVAHGNSSRRFTTISQGPA